MFFGRALHLEERPGAFAAAATSGASADSRPRTRPSGRFSRGSSSRSTKEHHTDSTCSQDPLPNLVALSHRFRSMKTPSGQDETGALANVAEGERGPTLAGTQQDGKSENENPSGI